MDQVSKMKKDHVKVDVKNADRTFVFLKRLLKFLLLNILFEFLKLFFQ